MFFRVFPRHLTTTTRIQFAFLLSFKFCIPGGVKITIALISMRQAKPEGFWYLVKWRHHANVLLVIRGTTLSRKDVIEKD